MVKRGLLLLLLGGFLFQFIFPVAAAASGMSEDQQRLFHENINYFDIATCDSGDAQGSACCNGSSVNNLTGSNNEEKTWNYFKGKGLSDKQVAGIMGNIADESHFDPEIMQVNGKDSKDPYDAGDLGWGIIQWSGNGTTGRSTGDKVKKMYDGSGVSGNVYDLGTQLNMVWQHMHNHPVVTQPFDLNHFKSITDVAEATSYFRSQIEAGANESGREQAAAEALKKYGGSGGDSSGNTTTSGSGGACAASTGSPDCANAQGNAKILCEAKKYDAVSYVWGGGHAGGAAYHKACPTLDSGQACGLDCSGLVSVAVFDAFGGSGKLAWDTNSLRADSTHWKQVSLSQAQAGDVIEPEPGHVEIIDHIAGHTVYTFGAHSADRPQPQQVGPDSFQAGGTYWRYIGPGSSA